MQQLEKEHGCQGLEIIGSKKCIETQGWRRQLGDSDAGSGHWKSRFKYGLQVTRDLIRSNVNNYLGLAKSFDGSILCCETPVSGSDYARAAITSSQAHPAACLQSRF